MDWSKSQTFKTLRALTVATLAAFAVSGCADRGKDLAEPKDWQTTTTRPLPPTSAPNSEASPSGIVLTSPDFEPGGNLPIDATCQGANMLPVLQWTNVPESAVELAVTVSNQTDPNEPILIWLAAGIDPSVTEIDPNVLPEFVVESTNDYGKVGYGDPCVDQLGEGLLDLQFRLHVIEQATEIEQGSRGNESWDRLRSLTVESASLLARQDNSQAAS